MVTSSRHEYPRNDKRTQAIILFHTISLVMRVVPHFIWIPLVVLIYYKLVESFHTQMTLFSFQFEIGYLSPHFICKLYAYLLYSRTECAITYLQIQVKYPHQFRVLRVLHLNKLLQSMSTKPFKKIEPFPSKEIQLYILMRNNLSHFLVIQKEIRLRTLVTYPSIKGWSTKHILPSNNIDPFSL